MVDPGMTFGPPKSRTMRYSRHRQRRMAELRSAPPSERLYVQEGFWLALATHVQPHKSLVNPSNPRGADVFLKGRPQLMVLVSESWKVVADVVLVHSLYA